MISEERWKTIYNNKHMRYWCRIYDSRFFWSHLARIDLKNKFRRSKLGVLWLCVNPLCLMIIMSIVFGTAFHQDMATYAPYILAGILFWNVMTDSFLVGAHSIIGSEPYIRQFNHPVIIYPLKTAITGIISFFISMLSLCVIMLFTHPVYIVLGIITLPLTALIYFIFEWSATIFAAYIGTKYRDYPQLAGLVLQTIWYLSPVFFSEQMFEGSVFLKTLFMVNPITHMLKLIREPFLYGRMPSLMNYAVSILNALVFVVIAYRINKENEKDIIFYI